LAVPLAILAMSVLVVVVLSPGITLPLQFVGVSHATLVVPVQVPFAACTMKTPMVRTAATMKADAEKRLTLLNERNVLRDERVLGIFMCYSRMSGGSPAALLLACAG
jgi:hypothetical protein